MYSTKNNTTMRCCHSTATVVARSTSPYTGTITTTLELVYPRYIHQELLTHRVVSRNASSSRATPVAAVIKEVREHPCFFDEVRKNQKGMVGGELLSPEENARFHVEWDALANHVANVAEKWATEYGIAKQTVNRVLEPFSYIRTLVTATEWDNFFKLRLAEDAQPEIRNLALAMKDSMDYADKIGFSKVSTSHIPYSYLFSEKGDDLVIRSVAACARVSIMRGDGKQTTIEEDRAFVKRLKDSGHMSPFEHVAKAAKVYDDTRFYNLINWRSLRYYIDNECEFILE